MDEHKLKRVESGVYDVIVNDTIIGRVERREQVGRNLVKSYVHSGSGRHVGLWEGTVSNAALDDAD